MGKLVVFNNVSVDGFFVDARGDMSWAHKHDSEWTAFAAENASGRGGTLLFGRVTYQMMASWWPTPMAARQMPEVAAGMNAMSKVVFSRTLKKADVTWANTRLVARGLVAAVKTLKAERGRSLVVLGSGTIVSQLTAAGLVDELQLVVNPLVLGAGRTLFDGLKAPVELKLKSARPFRNGNIVVTYAPRA
jgi:dihydrofolate reductase